MKTDVNYNIRLEDIRIFLNVAKTSSITESAYELHYTQPQISKTISFLEHQTGLILFYREKNRISLTPAGQYLYEQWDNIYLQMIRPLFYAATIQEARKKQLFVGCVDGLHSNEYLSQCFAKFRKNAPDVYLYVELYTVMDLIKKFENHELDIILLPRTCLKQIDTDQYNKRVLLDCSLALYYNKGCYQFPNSGVDLTCLSGEDFLVPTMYSYPHYKEYLFSLLQPVNTAPHIAMFLSSVNAIKMNVQMGTGIALLSSAYDFKSDVIGKIDLPDYPCEIFALWRKGTDNPAVKEFFSLCFD